jgi:hypothetical protein
MKRRKGGTISPEQKDIHAQMTALGHTVIVVYGAKDAYGQILDASHASH